MFKLFTIVTLMVSICFSLSLKKDTSTVHLYLYYPGSGSALFQYMNADGRRITMTSSITSPGFCSYLLNNSKIWLASPDVSDTVTLSSLGGTSGSILKYEPGFFGKKGTFILDKSNKQLIRCYVYVTSANPSLIADYTYYTYLNQLVNRKIKVNTCICQDSVLSGSLIDIIVQGEHFSQTVNRDGDCIKFNTNSTTTKTTGKYFYIKNTTSNIVYVQYTNVGGVNDTDVVLENSLKEIATAHGSSNAIVHNGTGTSNSIYPWCGDRLVVSDENSIKTISRVSLNIRLDIYPNPFVNSTTISVSTNKDGTLDVFGLNGNLIKSYSLRVGYNKIPWNTNVSGTYFVRMKNNSRMITRKLVVQ